MENYKQYKKAKKERNLAKRGEVGGSILAGVGAGMAGAGHLIDHLQNKGPEIIEKDGKILRKIKVDPALLKKAKITGYVAAGAGVPLVIASEIKKRNADKKLKEYGDLKKKK